MCVFGGLGHSVCSDFPLVEEVKSLEVEAGLGGEEGVDRPVPPFGAAHGEGQRSRRGGVLRRRAPAQDGGRRAHELDVGVGRDGAKALDHRDGEGTEDGFEDKKGLVSTQGLAEVEGCRSVKDAAGGVGLAGTRGGGQAEAQEEEKGGRWW